METRRIVARTHRIICSRFPTVGVFDDIAFDEDERRVAFALEDMTNRRHVETERLNRIPNGGVLAGPSASIGMAAFLHCNEDGGRFNDGKLGAWYAATEIETALQETIFHNHRRLSLSEGGFPNRIQMRELILDVDIDLLDLTAAANDRPELYDPDSYAQSQSFALERRWPFADPGLDGVVYNSVRRDGGTNVCIFRPTAMQLPIIQGDHYEYVWNAQGELTVARLSRAERAA